MRQTLTTAVASVCLAVVLTGCGSDDGTDAAEWGKGEVVGASPVATPKTPSGSPSDETTSAASPDDSGDSGGPEGLGDDTIPSTELSADQATLYEEMVLFEDVAKARAREGSGGGTTASFREAGEPEDRWLQRPDGISLAQRYAITWDGGKLLTYTLTTDARERMTYEAGRISLDVTVDPPRDQAFERAAQQLERAVDDWRTRNGEPPTVSTSPGRFTLAESFFGESEIKEVEVPFEGDISMKEFSSSNGDFSVDLRSGETGENAWLTQDGLTFSRPFEVVWVSRSAPTGPGRTWSSSSPRR